MKLDPENDGFHFVQYVQPFQINQCNIHVYPCRKCDTEEWSSVTQPQKEKLFGPYKCLPPKINVIIILLKASLKLLCIHYIAPYTSRKGLIINSKLLSYFLLEKLFLPEFMSP